MVASTLLQMTPPDSGSPHRISDPRQAYILTEPRSKEFFKPFLARPRTAQEAADELGCPINTVLYRVKVMFEVGLLRVVETRPRGGRSMKVYRSVHDSYFVPFSCTPYATLEERLAVQGKPIFAQLISAYAAALHASELYGHTLLRGENGGIWTTDRLPEVSPKGLPTVFSDMTVRLSDQEALEIARLLWGAYARSLRFKADAQSEQTSDYLMMVALLPLQHGS